MVDFYECREKMIKIKNIINSVVDQNGTQMFEVNWMNSWLSQEELEEMSEDASLLITEFKIQLQRQKRTEPSGVLTEHGDSDDLTFQSAKCFQDDSLNSLPSHVHKESVTTVATDQVGLDEKIYNDHLSTDDMAFIKEENGSETTEDFEDCEGTVFMCDICNATFSTHKSLSEHKRHCTSDNEMKVYSSTSCVERNSPVISKTVTTTIPYSHTSQSIPERGHADVNLECSGATRFEGHELTTSEQNREQKNYTNTVRLHHVSVINKDIYECENCRMTFADEEYLSRHMVRCKNPAEAHFRCEICQRGFTTKGSLELHVDAIHLKKKEFGCSLCGKLFSRKHILKVHLATHYGKREFECSTCGKKFLQKGNLNRHERIHQAKNFGYKCRYCGQAFTQNKHLQKHLISQHEHSLNQDQVPQ